MSCCGSLNREQDVRKRVYRDGGYSASVGNVAAAGQQYLLIFIDLHNDNVGHFFLRGPFPTLVVLIIDAVHLHSPSLSRSTDVRHDFPSSCALKLLVQEFPGLGRCQWLLEMLAERGLRICGIGPCDIIDLWR
jgi:hypothetical protein